MCALGAAAARVMKRATWRTAAICGTLLLAVFYMLSPPGGAAPGSGSRRLSRFSAGGASGACERGAGAPPLPALPRRSDLARLVEERGFKVGAELGVQRGIFAAAMLRNWPSCEKYYLVDIWAQQ
ncbi:hypothetical protein Rsub_13297, partial [Raphidocelis subcapitata]